MCNGNSDCASGSCETGVCANATPPLGGCTDDSNCTDGMVCQNGQCRTPTIQNSTSCTSNSDCSSGTCNTATGECVQATGVPLLSLILIILGLLTMGGSGYWLYSLHEARIQEENRRQSSEQGYTSAQQELTPEQRLTLLRQRQAQLAALRQRQAEATQQREAAKQAARQSVLNSLDGKPAGPAAPATGATPAGQEAGQEGGSEERVTDGDFVDLAELSKRQAATKEPAQAPSSPARSKKKVAKKESDAFSDLDKVIGGK